MADMINHPPHYTNSRFTCECIEVASLFDFTLGNAVKYIWRHKDKGNALEDLRKARFYVASSLDSGVTVKENIEAIKKINEHVLPHLILNPHSPYWTMKYIAHGNLVMALQCLEAGNIIDNG